MKDKKTFLIIILAFVLLMGGAYLLYDHLGDRVDVPHLSVQTTPPPQITLPPHDHDTPTDPTPGEAYDPDPDEYTPAPGFTVYDLEGNPVKLSDFLGKPVVLNFWSSRCYPCQKEMPDFQKVYEQLGDEVQFLMVNVTDGSWDTVDSASKYIQQNGYTFPVFYDTGSSAAFSYGITSLPSTFFISSEGFGIAYAIGGIDMDILMRGIAMIYPEAELES